MPIYRIQWTKAVQIPFLLDGFGNEFKLRDFFADNLEEILGVRFLAKEYPTDWGRMDTIGIDENNCPVIIEYKWKENEEVFAQWLFYLDWLKRNKPHFNLLVQSKLWNDTSVNWDSIRVILVAQGFSRYVEAAVQQVNNVELKTYALYENEIIHIENVFGWKNKRAQKNHSEWEAKNDEGIQSSLEVPEEANDVERHANKLGDSLRENFYTMRDRILELPSVEEKELKGGVTYKTTRSFVSFQNFGKDKLQVLVRDSSYAKDTEGIVTDISSYNWWYKWRIAMNSGSDFQKILEIISESYNSTL